LKEKIIQGLKFCIFLAIGIGAVYYFYMNMEPEDRENAINSMKNANYFWLGLSLVIGSFAQFSRAIRWQMLIKPLGFRPGFLNTLLAVMISYFANLLFPRLGEVSRCAVLNRYEKVPMQHLIGTVITERILDVIALALVLLIGFVVEFDKIIEYFNNGFQEANATAATVEQKSFFARNFILLTIGIGAATLTLTFFAFRKAIMKLRFYHKVRDAAKGMIDGVKSVRHVDKVGWMVFHSVFIWICYYMMMYVCIFSIPETSHLSFGAVITAFVIGSVAMIISPGGIGLYPVFVAGALMLYGVDKAFGSSFGMLVWGTQTISIVAFGAISFILLPIINRTSGKNNAQPNATTS